MGKLPNVTLEDLKALDRTGGDLTADLWNVHSRLEKGYCDDIASPVSFARAFLSLSRAAADVAAMLLSKAAMQELQRETEEAIRARMNGFMVVDCFTSLDDLKPSDWRHYERVKAAALAAGRFSVFEATRNDLTARQMTTLCRDPDVEIDNTCAYPWTLVRRRDQSKAHGR